MKIDLTIENKLEIAKWIVDNNDACLTGSLMLYVRGFKLNREPYDIDIVVSSFEHLKLPPMCYEIKDDSYPTEDYLKFEYLGTTIDLFLDNNAMHASSKTSEDSIRLATVKSLFLAKSKYIFDKNITEEKYDKLLNDLRDILEQQRNFNSESMSYYMVKDDGTIHMFEPNSHAKDGWNYFFRYKKPNEGIKTVNIVSQREVNLMLEAPHHAIYNKYVEAFACSMTIYRKR